jgi:hypothetical protein
MPRADVWYTADVSEIIALSISGLKMETITISEMSTIQHTSRSYIPKQDPPYYRTTVKLRSRKVIAF